MTRPRGHCHGRPTQPAEMGAHLRGDRVLLRHRQLAPMPRLARPAERGRDDVRERLTRAGARRRSGRAWPTRPGDRSQRHPLDERVAELGRVVERGRARLVEDAGRLADPPAVADPVAQPLHALHVRLAVAALAARGAHGPEHAVALLPLAERVGRDAGTARESVMLRSAVGIGRLLDMIGSVGCSPLGRHLRHRSTVSRQHPCPKATLSTARPCGSSPLVGHRVAAPLAAPSRAGDGRRGGGRRADAGKRRGDRQASPAPLRRRRHGAQPPAPDRALAGRPPRAHVRSDDRGSSSQAGGLEATQWNGPVLTLEQRALRRLAPDLLADGTEPERSCRGSGERIRAVALGEALQDQHLVAGIGNMWMSEALWAVRVSPWRPLGRVSDDELVAALGWAREAMRASIAGSRARRSVYRRAGRPCPRCATPIESRGQGDANRTAYWCPGCQS